MTIFNEKDFNFIDSIIDKIEVKNNCQDFSISIDYYLANTNPGESPASQIIKLELKNVCSFSFHKIDLGIDVYTPITISHISKEYVEAGIKITIFPVVELLQKYKTTPPIITCICKNAYICKE